jgi:hypothetical protein
MIVGTVVLCYVLAYFGARMEESRTGDADQRRRERERTSHNALILWAILMAALSVIPAEEYGRLMGLFWTGIVRMAVVGYAIYSLSKRWEYRRGGALPPETPLPGSWPGL